MNVIDAMYFRRATRAFKPDPVDGDTIVKILQTAKQSPSWANSQPWEVYVAGGEALGRINKEFSARFDRDDPPKCDISMKRSFPPEIQARIDDNNTRRFAVMGLDRNDKNARREKSRANHNAFGAPAVAYIGMDNTLLPWSLYDLGLFSQSLMLSAQEYGVDSLASIILVVYPDVIRRELEVPDNIMIVIGLALGYADADHPANKHRSARRAVEEFARIKMS